ncbi:hypothetical protein CEXT_179231 [Caerostris extrusa]|uniref:Uncharacterized protein n=1 Tax=Caerostris extrusa TaxID=172846 RepID=A0AAV4QUE8_CAEEX|nr:hypothetical protein CEXT_179231 [Caerostris extrusa]
MLGKCLEGDFAALTVVADNFSDRSSSIPTVEILVSFRVLNIKPSLGSHRGRGFRDREEALSLSNNLRTNARQKLERVIRGSEESESRTGCASDWLGSTCTSPSDSTASNVGRLFFLRRRLRDEGIDRGVATCSADAFLCAEIWFRSP